MRRKFLIRSLIPILSLLFVLPVGPAEGEESTAYGHVRTLEGSVAISRADTGEREELLANYPLQTRDRLETGPLAAAELVLADFNIVRLGAQTEVVLTQLAFSADSDDRRTSVVLVQGELQLEVTEYALGDELPRIETPGATIRVHEPGMYLISANASGVMRVIVRTGFAEVETEKGSRVAGAQQEVVVEPGDDSEIVTVAAGPLQPLERWGEELSTAADAAVTPEVEPALGYSAAALEHSGEWVEAEGAKAWRPRSASGWRPFTSGFWIETRSGLTWVGFEPWSWVTSHYGHWSLDASWGWVWYPGHAYSPAHVYWYWGSDWVGWVPSGYYGRRHGAPHFYGYAGGPWSYYRDWTFCSSRYFGQRGGHRYHHGGREMAERSGRPVVPRGVVATETSGIGRVQWRDGGRVARELLSRGRDESGAARPRDLTDFVAGRTDRPRMTAGRVTAGGFLGRAPESGGPSDGFRRRNTFDAARVRPWAAPRRRDGWAPFEPEAEAPDRPDRDLTRAPDPPVRRLVERLRSRRELLDPGYKTRSRGSDDNGPAFRVDRSPAGPQLESPQGSAEAGDGAREAGRSRESKAPSRPKRPERSDG